MTDETQTQGKSWRDTPDHYEGIGHLVTAYTTLELTIKSVLFNLLNLPEVEFNILLEFGRIKTADMPTIIAKLAESRTGADPDRKLELITAAKTFDRLSQSRNQLVHWLWMGGGEMPTLLNLKPRAQPTRADPKAVSIAELSELMQTIWMTNAQLCSFLKGAADPFTLLEITE